ncbi:unnamed protein product, partial [Dicrocoelium dendriticum]
MEDYITYAGIVNRECERFKLASMTETQFKCLMFICGLQSPPDADLCTRLLTRLEQDPGITLQKMAEECQRLLNLKHDSRMVEQLQINMADVRPVRAYKQEFKKPPTACWNCGAWHYASQCTFRRHRCNQCQRFGYKDGFCKPRNSTIADNSNKRFPKPPQKASRSIVASYQVNATSRRRYLTVSVNGYPATLQVDTGSDITIISQTIWESIGRPPVMPTQQTALSASGTTLGLV